jgi:hypothetical protein
MHIANAVNLKPVEFMVLFPVFVGSKGTILRSGMATDDPCGARCVQILLYFDIKKNNYFLQAVANARFAPDNGNIADNPDCSTYG